MESYKGAVGQAGHLHNGIHGDSHSDRGADLHEAIRGDYPQANVPSP